MNAQTDKTMCYLMINLGLIFMESLIIQHIFCRCTNIEVIIRECLVKA